MQKLLILGVCIAKNMILFIQEFMINLEVLDELDLNRPKSCRLGIELLDAESKDAEIPDSWKASPDVPEAEDTAIESDWAVFSAYKIIWIWIE